jgi:hypothetical protein
LLCYSMNCWFQNFKLSRNLLIYDEYRFTTKSPSGVFIELVFF